MRVHTFASGRRARLASWNKLEAPTHGDDLFATPWDESMGRAGLDFYPSTREHMNNTWAFENLQSTNITGPDGEHITTLFQWPETGTWHTIDAYDIDHAVPATTYASQVGADNLAEANIAYNDIGNLRLMPSVANRSHYWETSPPRVPDGWVEAQFGSLTLDDRPRLRATNRLARTMRTPWSIDEGRSRLRFDGNIKKGWFENRLRQNYVGTAKMPDGRDVQLFRCEATEQAVTRDALEIDHKEPISLVLRRRQPTTLGDALNLYNDPDNLRLVAAGANRSHEWERGEDGDWMDLDDEPEKPHEFDGFLDPSPSRFTPQERAELDYLTRRTPIARPAPSGPIQGLKRKPESVDEPAAKRPRLSPQEAEAAPPARPARVAQPARSARTLRPARGARAARGADSTVEAADAGTEAVSSSAAGAEEASEAAGAADAVLDMMVLAAL